MSFNDDAVGGSFGPRKLKREDSIDGEIVDIGEGKKKVRMHDPDLSPDEADEKVIEECLDKLREHFQSDDIFIIAAKSDGVSKIDADVPRQRFYAVTPRMDMRTGGLLLLTAVQTFFKHVAKLPDEIIQAVAVTGLDYIQGAQKAERDFSKAGKEVEKFLKNLYETKPDEEEK